MKMRVAALAVVMVMTITGAAQAQVSKTFRDWMVICDNTRVCAAFGFSTSPGDGFLKIERQPGPGGKLEAGLALFPFGDEPPPADGWTVKADGVVLFDDLTFEVGEWGATRVFGGEDAVRLVAAARDASTLTVEGPGGLTSDIVLSGSSASLRFIDDQQGRAGLTDALAARGDGSPGMAATPPVMPVISVPATPDQSGLPTRLPAFMANLQKHEDCDSLGSPEDFPPIKARLAPDLILWGGICSSGAYNFSYKFFTSDQRGGNVKELSFPYAPGSEENDTVYVTNADFDPDSLTMTAFEKGRGLGDCGSILSWVWNGEAFVLLRQDIMPDCRGVGAEYWPTLYRATPDQAR